VRSKRLTSSINSTGWFSAQRDISVAMIRLADQRQIRCSFPPALRSRDGSRIVTAARDNTARIWDAVTGKEIAVLRGHDKGVRSAAFSPDGFRIVTASDDNTARIWDVRLPMMSGKNLLVEACARLGGRAELTREEMRLAGYPESMPEIDVCASGQ
jgi:WD40 repeat protein